MFKKDKKLFITLILMFVIVASLVVITFLYEGRNQDYQNIIETKDRKINSMVISYGELEKENDNLLKDIKNLNEENESLKNRLGNFSNEADLTIYTQTLNDLSDISHMIKQGNINGAKKELLKMDTNGFDPTCLAFYESLCRELNIK